MTAYRYRSYYNPEISLTDRILSCLSCLTSGLVGFIWLIIAHARGHGLSSFGKFYALQSILVFFIFYVVGIILNIFMGIIGIMPFIGPLVVNIVYSIADKPLLFGYSLTSLFVGGVALYMAIYAFLGWYAEVPYVSSTVRRMI
jgi:uncharacterized membrane protein